MNKVFSILKETGSYGERKLLLIGTSTLLPLIFAAPLGPEAGITGLITALSIRVEKLITKKKQELKELSEVSLSASLAVLFNAPLFEFINFFNNDDTTVEKTKHTTATFIALIGGFTGIYLVSHFTGLSSGGNTRFTENTNITL